MRRKLGCMERRIVPCAQAEVAMQRSAFHANDFKISIAYEL